MKTLRWLSLVVALFSATFSFAQGTATLTGQVSASDSVSWNLATWQMSLDTSGGPFVNSCGGPNTFNVSGQLDTTGNFQSNTVIQNTCISPPSTTYQISICPIANSACQTVHSITVSGSSFNLGAYLHTRLSIPTVDISLLPITTTVPVAYATSQVVNPKAGTMVYLGGTTYSCFNYSVSSWATCNGSGGSSITGNPFNAVTLNSGGTASDSGAQNRTLITPSSARISKVSSSDVNGLPNEPFQILYGSNSKAIGNNVYEVFNFCTHATWGANGALPLFKQSTCRNIVSFTSASNIVSLIVTDNTDGYIKTGDRFSIGGPSSDCLTAGVSYNVTNVSGNTITFDTTGTILPCGTVGSTPVANDRYTKQIQVFGINGAPLSAWLASTGQWGWSGPNGMQAYAQRLIQQGITPVIWIGDGGIGTNTIRFGGFTYAQYMAGFDSFIDTLEATSATRPDGKIVTLAQYDVFLDNGNPMSNAGTAWAATQYVFPNGTASSAITTPPTITSASQSGSPVTTLTANIQAIVTVNYCPNDLWGGSGISAPRDINFANQLLLNGNPLQMVLDTTVSGVQETVTLLPFNNGSGTASTGILSSGAGSQTGTLSCTFSFTPINAHTVSGLQIVSTRATADQTYSHYLAQSVYDESQRYGNLHPIDFQKFIFGKQSISTNTSEWTQDELHPSLLGYGRMAMYRLSTIAPLFNSSLTAIVPADDVQLDDLSWLTENKNKTDSNFSNLLATKARVNGTFYNPQGDSEQCKDNNLYYTTIEGTVAQIGSTFIRMGVVPAISTQTTWAGDVQTGDWIYSPIFGCWQPTTIAAPTLFTTNALAMTITGNPPIPLASIPPGSQLKVRRQLAVDSLAISFLSHPDTYKSVLVGTIVSGASGTFTTSLDQGQRRDVPYNITASQISLISSDHIVVRGNGTTIPTGGVDVVLPNGGVSSTSGTNIVWNDSTAFNYSIYAGQKINIFSTRPMDQVATTINASNVVAYGGVTIPSLSQPSLINADLTTAATGGSFGDGTYFYKYTIRPIGNSVGNSSQGSTEATITLSAGTITQKININSFPTPRPAGYVIDVYRSTATNTETFIATLPIGATSFIDTGFTNLSATPSTIDLSGSNGNAMFTPNKPTAIGQLPLSINPLSMQMSMTTFKYAISFTPTAATISSCVEQTVTVTGVSSGQSIVATPPSALNAHVWIGSARVSAINTVAVDFCADAVGGTPSSGTWTFLAL